MSWFSKWTGADARKEANAKAQEVAISGAELQRKRADEQQAGLEQMNRDLQAGMEKHNDSVRSSVDDMNATIGERYGEMDGRIGEMYGGLNDKYQSVMDSYKQETKQNIAAVDRSFDRSDSTSRARMLAMGFNPDSSDVFARNEAQMATQRGLAKEDILNRATQNTYGAQMQGLGAQSQNTTAGLGMQSQNMGAGLGMQAGNINTRNAQLSSNIGGMYGQMSGNLVNAYGLSNQGYGAAQQGLQDAANAQVADAANKNGSFWRNVTAGAIAAGSIAAAPMTGGASLSGLGAAAKVREGG